MMTQRQGEMNGVWIVKSLAHLFKEMPKTLDWERKLQKLDLETMSITDALRDSFSKQVKN